MLGWLVFAIIVAAIVGVRVAGFFRHQKSEGSQERQAVAYRDDNFHDYSQNHDWERQTFEEFKCMNRW